MSDNTLSHLVLFGTSIYCLNKYGFSGSNLRFPHVSYLSIIAYSMFGVWRWGDSEYDGDVRDSYNFCKVLQTLFALPCITTEVCIMYGYQRQFALLLTAAPTLSLVLYLMNENINDIVKLTNLVSCTTLGILSYFNENFWGMAAAISYFLTSIRRGDEPSENIRNYGLCFFAYFSLLTLQGKQIG